MSIERFKIMELFIPDLYEVLKCRTKKLTSIKESDKPEDVLARLKDVENICAEIRAKAEAQAVEIEKLRSEADGQTT